MGERQIDTPCRENWVIEFILVDYGGQSEGKRGGKIIGDKGKKQKLSLQEKSRQRQREREHTGDGEEVGCTCLSRREV